MNSSVDRRKKRCELFLFKNKHAYLSIALSLTTPHMLLPSSSNRRCFVDLRFYWQWWRCLLSFISLGPRFYQNVLFLCEITVCVIDFSGGANHLWHAAIILRGSETAGASHCRLLVIFFTLREDQNLDEAGSQTSFITHSFTRAGSTFYCTEHIRRNTVYIADDDDKTYHNTINNTCELKTIKKIQ